MLDVATVLMAGFPGISSRLNLIDFVEILSQMRHLDRTRHQRTTVFSLIFLADCPS